AISDFTLIAVLIAHEAVGFDASKRDVRYTEAALRALRERSSIPGPMSEDMLHGKFENPLLGVLAALLQLRRKDLTVSSLREVVENLLRLVGPSPDVLAIGLGMINRDESLRADAEFRQRVGVPSILG